MPSSMHTSGRRVLTDAAVVAVCLLLGLILFSLEAMAQGIDLEHTTPREDAVLAVDMGLGILACFLAPLTRSPRRWLALGVALVLGIASGASAWAFPVFAFALVTVASWRRPWPIVLLCAVTLGANSVLYPLLWREPLSWLDAGGTLALMAALSGWGLYRGQKKAALEMYRERAEMLQREARLAQREQEARIAQVRAEERTAIAREMHDTLSHRLAVIALHAGALSSRKDLGPEQVMQTGELMLQVAQQGNEELRALLTVLRADPTDRQRPATLEQLDEQLAAAEQTGQQVRLVLDDSVRGRLAALPEQRSVAMTQAIHEGLANALKHAPGSPVDISFTDEGEDLQVSVSNPLREGSTLPSNGYGLVGLDERLTLAGGGMRHGTHDGRHELVAWVPWT